MPRRSGNIGLSPASWQVKAAQCLFDNADEDDNDVVVMLQQTTQTRVLYGRK